MGATRPAANHRQPPKRDGGRDRLELRQAPRRRDRHHPPPRLPAAPRRVTHPRRTRPATRAAARPALAGRHRNRPRVDDGHAPLPVRRSWMPKFTQEGSIVALGPLLHPDRMQIFIRGNNVSYALDGRESYGPPEIVFVRGLLDSIGLRGMSPVSPAQSAFELNEALRESSHQFFKEGSRPSGVLTVGEGASEAAIKSLREDWRNLYSAAGGIQNMHRVAVLRGEMNFTPITFSIADQEFLGIPRVQCQGDRRDLRTAGMGGQRRQRLEPHLRQHDPAGAIPDPAQLPADHQPHRSRAQRRPDLVSRQHVLRI